MKIVCEQCGAKYQIQDGKVKNKPFKIRCKSCAHVIVVQPPSAHTQDEESTRQVSAQAAMSAAQEERAPAPQEEVPQWYAVIQGNQQGPFTEAQLNSYWAQGQINAETYVWCDGMAGWEPITQVESLRPLWGRSTPEETPSSQHAVAPQARHAVESQAQHAVESQAQHAVESQAQHAVKSQAQHRQEPAADHRAHEPMYSKSSQVQASSQQSAPSPRDDDDLMSSSEPILNHKETPMALSAGQEALRNQRNENSVLFSLDSLELGRAAKVQNPAPSPKVTNTGGTEGSGLIDISALGSVGNGAASEGHADPAPLNLKVGLPRQHTMVSQGGSIRNIIFSVIAAVSISVVGVLFFLNKTAISDAQKGPIVIGNASSANATSNTALPSKGSTNRSSTNTSGAQNTPVSTAVLPLTTAKSQASVVTPPLPTPSNQQTPPKPRVEKSADSKKSKVRSRKRSSRREKRSTPKPNVSTRNTPKPRRKTNSKRRTGEASNLLKNLRGGKAKRTPPPSILGGGGGAKSGPKKPSKKSIVSSMKRVNTRRCGSRDPSLRGTVKVKIKAVSSGAITRANVQNAPFRGTPVGACIEREVKKQRFPQFTDPSISFTFPFKL